MFMLLADFDLISFPALSCHPFEGHALAGIRRYLDLNAVVSGLQGSYAV